MRMIRNVIAVAVGLLVVVAGLVAPAGVSEAAPAGRLTLHAGRTITAQFSGTKLDKNRVVNLERSARGAAWRTVKAVRMNSKGAVNFGVVASEPGYYRAVARAFSYRVGTKRKVSARVVGQTRHLAVPTFSEGFSGRTLRGAWRSRDEVGYRANGRLCSAPVRRNTVVKGGSAVLKMTKVRGSEAKAAIAKAKVNQRKANPAAVKAYAAVRKAKSAVARAKAMKRTTASQRKARSAAIKRAQVSLRKATTKLSALTPGCPNGVFHNAMITTRGGVKPVRSGTLVTRVKFSAAQGAHAGIWLQAANRQEIDVIETYGHGRGITNVIHRLRGSTLQKDPEGADAAYVAINAVRSRSWWSKWHTVAVSFDPGTITFHLDGVKTRQLKGMKAADYDLMLSLLSSDWETARVTKPLARSGSGVKNSSIKKQKNLPSMTVDWIRIWKKA